MEISIISKFDFSLLLKTQPEGRCLAAALEEDTLVMIISGGFNIIAVKLGSNKTSLELMDEGRVLLIDDEEFLVEELLKRDNKVLL